jgi:hypothetical protein
MKSKPFQYHSPEAVSDSAVRKGFAKGWTAILAAAGLGVGMLLVQSCSPNAKAGPNGGDVVALGDGKTSAEVLSNAESGEVMVHTWNNDLKSARPVEARPLTMGADDKQLQLEPHPLASDPPGYCSRFYGRADWLRGGSAQHGWLGHSGAENGRMHFDWNRGWKAGGMHGGMWSEMGGHGPGMSQGGHGGRHH